MKNMLETRDENPDITTSIEEWFQKERVKKNEGRQYSQNNSISQNWMKKDVKPQIEIAYHKLDKTNEKKSQPSQILVKIQTLSITRKASEEENKQKQKSRMRLTLDFLSTTNGCKKIWKSVFKISKDMHIVKSFAIHSQIYLYKSPITLLPSANSIWNGNIPQSCTNPEYFLLFLIFANLRGKIVSQCLGLHCSIR